MHRLIAVAAACALLLGACTKADQSATPASGRHPWTHPGHLVIGSAGEEPDSLNEMFAHTDAADQLANLLYEPLFRYAPNGDYLPAAATEVPPLRKGMQWSDGAPYDARDLLFTWRAVMNPANNVKQRTGWDDITAISLSPDN